MVLMQLAGPECFKASEEAVTSVGEIEELPFVDVHRYLLALGIPVPAVYWYDSAAGLLYLEDLGDRTLAEACAKGAAVEIETWYSQAIDILVQMHSSSTDQFRHRRNKRCVAFQRAFDVPLLMWEFDHFLEYGIEARRGTPLPSADRDRIRTIFHEIATLLAEQPPVFTHRDYHSRNIMVRDKGLSIIDFQDALLGPASYDLASLLRDSYLAFEDAFIDRMIDRYLAGMRAMLPRSVVASMVLHDRHAFRRVFDLTSIQRNLKAAGRFVYIDRVKHNPKFLADIPRTLAYVRRNVEKYPELAALRESLTPYIPEWQ